jgi:adenylate kinase
MNVVFFGPPGAGKGTVAGMVSARSGLPHISTGDLFREAIKNRTDLGIRVQAIIESGALVPDELTVAILAERVALPDTVSGVLLDGFPRTIAQADALSQMMSIDYVINLRTDDAMIIRRLSGRRVCRSCGNIHHVEFIPPKVDSVCDRCGGELYQRKDDTAEAITRRLEVYAQQTESLIDYYRSKELLVDIDANPDAQTVCSEVCRVLGIAPG